MVCVIIYTSRQTQSNKEINMNTYTITYQSDDNIDGDHTETFEVKATSAKEAHLQFLAFIADVDFIILDIKKK